jgi:hypothetical protein
MIIGSRVSTYGVCPKSCKNVTSSLRVVQNLCYVSRATNDTLGNQYPGLPILDLHKITCNGPAFTQENLPTPKVLLKLGTLKNHTIALPSDLAGTNVTGTCLRVKRHDAPVFSIMFGLLVMLKVGKHVEGWARTLLILIVDTTEKKRMKRGFLKCFRRIQRLRQSKPPYVVISETKGLCRVLDPDFLQRRSPIA